MFLGKGVPKICSQLTGENHCQSVISTKLESNFIEVTLRYECSPVNLLHIFRTPYFKNTFGWLLLLTNVILCSYFIYVIYFLNLSKQFDLVLNYHSLDFFLCPATWRMKAKKGYLWRCKQCLI